MTAIDRKSVLAQQVQRKIGGHVTIQMLDLTAHHTFFMKMIAAVTALTNVLIDVAATLLAAEFSHNVLVAKLGQMTVNTAFSDRCLCADRGIQVCTKLLRDGQSRHTARLP